MNGNDIIALGLGLQAPWEIIGQTLNAEKSPHELRLTIQARRGTRYPCPHMNLKINRAYLLKERFRDLWSYKTKLDVVK